ncbi:hypothetical protein [Shewanella sp. 10N.286.52.B9]|uniref:hypothetical protein n=1 Tax=Shewanella sp. 10N.286.52.B9 TaxID=1880837 RepID=UPI000C83BE7E|nr:hypothetical protein [Shewanella sp. 10N.286.52.B9]PMG43405.1 hypothetical protein BCU91_00475 [Shewanella sp. 10N.286.52.B9]
MLIRTVCIFVTFLLVACGGGGDSESSPATPTIPTITNHIQGRWLLKIPDTECIETFIFNDDLSSKIISSQQVTTAIYQFQSQVNSGTKHPLTINFTHSNLLPDCEGNTQDLAGNSLSVFVDFNDEFEMEWYEDAEHSAPLVTFIKEPEITLSQLPEIVSYGEVMRVKVETTPDLGVLPELLYGPNGMTISADGTLNWEAHSIAFSAEQEIKFSLTIPNYGVTKQFSIKQKSDAALNVYSELSTSGKERDISIANFLSLNKKQILILKNNKQIALLDKNGEEYTQQWSYPYHLDALKLSHYDFEGDRLNHIVVMNSDQILSIDPNTNKKSVIVEIEKFEESHILRDKKFVDFSIADLNDDGHAEIVLIIACKDCGNTPNHDLWVWDTGSNSISSLYDLNSQPSEVQIGSIIDKNLKHILLDDGLVFDNELKKLNWLHADSENTLFTLADIDGNEIEEIISYNKQEQSIEMLKYGESSPITHLAIEEDICSLHVTPLKSIVTGPCSSYGGNMNSYSSEKLELQWSELSNHTNNIISAVTENSGEVELLRSGNSSISSFKLTPYPEVVWGLNYSTASTNYHTAGNIVEGGSFKALFYSPQHNWNLYSVSENGQKEKNNLYKLENGINGSIHAIDIFDANLDGVNEVIINTKYEEGFTLFAQELASEVLLWEKSFSQNSERYVSSVEMEHADINNDGYNDLIVVNSEQLYVEDLVNQTVLWDYKPTEVSTILDADFSRNKEGTLIAVVAIEKRDSNYHLFNSTEQFKFIDGAFVPASTASLLCSKIVLINQATNIACLSSHGSPYGNSTELLILDNSLTQINSFFIDGEVSNILQPQDSDNLLISSCDSGETGLSNNPNCTLSMRSVNSGDIIWQTPRLLGAITTNSIEYMPSKDGSKPRLSFATKNAMYMVEL